MAGELVPVGEMELGEQVALPAIVLEQGRAAAFAYAEFFEAAIASPHTYRAYRTAVDRFLTWCAGRGIELNAISPALLGEYVRKLSGSKPTKKLHLSALRRFF